MKLMIKLLSAILALSLINPSYSQKVLKPFPKNQWHVERSDQATGNSFTRSAFRKSINYLPNGGAVVAVNFNKGECGAARINENGKTLWDFQTKGVTVGVGRMNNDFIVFYSNEGESNKGRYREWDATSSTVRAAIINGENGKLIKDILMFENEEKIEIESRPLNRPDGSFSTLFVRVTDFERPSFNNQKRIEEKLSSPKILMIGIDNNFNPKVTQIKSIGQKGLFAGAELGANDDLFLSTIVDDQLIAERFNSSGKAVGKLSVPLSVRTSNNIESVTSIDARDQNSLFLALGYTNKSKDRANQVFEFNFKENKISGSGEQVLDKSYLKSFEVSEVKESYNGGKHSEIDDYHLSNFLITSDRVVIVKGYQFDFSYGKNSVRYQNEKVAIEIFDRKWNKLKGIILDRKLELFDPACRSIGATINNGKLYTILPTIIGIGKIGTLFTEIDLSTPKVDKYVLLEDPYIRRGIKGPVIESDASIWLKDGVLVENCGDESGLFSSKDNISSIWQKIEY